MSFFPLCLGDCAHGNHLIADSVPSGLWRERCSFGGRQEGRHGSALNPLHRLRSQEVLLLVAHSGLAKLFALVSSAGCDHHVIKIPFAPSSTNAPRGTKRGRGREPTSPPVPLIVQPTDFLQQSSTACSSRINRAPGAAQQAPERPLIRRCRAGHVCLS